MFKKKKILIGTRGSELALWQANWVKNLITYKNPEISVELVVIKTTGDKLLNVSLAKAGGKGLFVKEIEDAMLNNRIDMAVHSMKDMPTEIPSGLCIGAIPEREDTRDVLICREEFCFSKFSKGSRIGTSSLRRSAQLLHYAPDLEIVPIRGNLGTRLYKLGKHKLDAIVLAAAGLIRLGFEQQISHYMEPKIMLPAVGQGALCVEVREDDTEVAQLLDTVDDIDTRCVVSAERAFLARLDGGCQVPIAASGVLDAGRITLVGLVASVDGSHLIKKTLTGLASCPEEIGTELAEVLLSLGAGDIIREFIINEKK